MASDPLGARGSHNIGAEFDGAARKAAHSKGVDDEGKLVLFADSRDGLKVAHGVAWVGDCLHVDRLCIFVDESLDLLRLGAVKELDGDAHVFEGMSKLRIRAPVQIIGSYKVVSGAAQGKHSVHLRCLTAGSGEGADGCAPSRSQPLPSSFAIRRPPSMRRGVHDAGVNGTELLEGEELCAMLCILETKRCRCVNGGCTSAVIRVVPLTVVKLKRREPDISVVVVRIDGSCAGRACFRLFALAFEDWHYCVLYALLLLILFCWLKCVVVVFREA